MWPFTDETLLTYNQSMDCEDAGKCLKKYCTFKETIIYCFLDCKGITNK